MSVLFSVLAPSTGVTLHVLQIRNRTAFLAREIGLAAGASDDGQGFLDNIVREWAPSLDEDDDIAQLTGAELDMLKREVPLPPETTMALVLFATGAERALSRSRLRFARSLILYLHAEVLSRVLTLDRDPDDGGQGGAPASPGTASPGAPKKTASPPAPTPSASPAMLWNQLIVSLNVVADKQALTIAASERLCNRVVAYDALRELASQLRSAELIDDEEWGAIRVEAVEELLGRRLRTYLPSLADNDDAAFAS